MVAPLPGVLLRPDLFAHARWLAFSERLAVPNDCSGTQGLPSSPDIARSLEKAGGQPW